MKAEDIRELVYEAKTRLDPTPKQSADLIDGLVRALEDALPALYADSQLTRATLADFLGLADEKYLEAICLPAPDSPSGWRPETIAFWDRHRTKREISQGEYEAAIHRDEHSEEASSDDH